MVKRDREAYSSNMILEATAAAKRGDSKAMWTLIKRLTDSAPKTLRAVKSEDGKYVLVDESDIKTRWNEYFAQLLKAEHAADVDALMTHSLGTFDNISYRPSVLRTKQLIGESKRNKAPGPDAITGELLRAGGSGLAFHITHLLEHIAKDATVPIDFRGGKLKEVWKRKGDPQVCPNSRGLLVSDELSKIFTGSLQAELKHTYEQFVSETQCGAVAKRGSDFAKHLARSALDFAYLKNWCSFILFLDLEKAFDFVVWEYLWDGAKTSKEIQ